MQTELHGERKKRGSGFRLADVGKAETKEKRAILQKAKDTSYTNT